MGIVPQPIEWIEGETVCGTWMSFKIPSNPKPFYGSLINTEKYIAGCCSGEQKLKYIVSDY